MKIIVEVECKRHSCILELVYQYLSLAEEVSGRPDVRRRRSKPEVEPSFLTETSVRSCRLQF
jgi:hypothetical protein